MYLSNLTTIIKLEADSKIVASAGNRHDYQSNRSNILKPGKKLHHMSFAIIFVRMKRDDMPDGERVFQNTFDCPI